MIAIATDAEWKVYPLVLTQEKVGELWSKFQDYRTLFSDLTRGDIANFTKALMDEQSCWFEVTNGEDLVGLMWLTDTHQLIDVSVHLVFFDRKPGEKLNLCRKMILWAFDNFPINRMSASPPAIYFATIQLLKKIGFVHEGTKRKALPIGGKWVDVSLYGLTRSEVAQWDSQEK